MLSKIWDEQNEDQVQNLLESLEIKKKLINFMEEERAYIKKEEEKILVRLERIDKLKTLVEGINEEIEQTRESLK